MWNLGNNVVPWAIIYVIVSQQLQWLWYMSQVTYGITRICCIGFLRIYSWQLADVCEPSAESSQVIQGNIAGYPQNLRMVPTECSAEGLPPERSKEIRWLHNPLSTVGGWTACNPIACGLLNVLRTPKDDSADGRRWFCGQPKDNSMGSPQMIHRAA